MGRTMRDAWRWSGRAGARRRPAGPTAAAAAAEGADAAITFQVTGDPEETRVYRELADLYRRQTGRSVRIVEVPEREVHLARLTTGFAARRAPDVFLINYRNMGGFAARGVIDPAGPRLDASSVFAREDFYPLPLQASSSTERSNACPRTRRAWRSTTTSTRSARRASKPPRGLDLRGVHGGGRGADRRRAARRRHRREHDPDRAVDVGRGRGAGRRRGRDPSGSCSTRRRAAAGSTGCSRCGAKAGRRPRTRRTRRRWTSGSSTAAWRC